MNYIEFVEYIKNSFKKLMGAEADIQLKKIIKNNDCELDALIILERGNFISPTIYLNDYFEAYGMGMPIGDIISGIYNVYRKYRIEGKVSVDLFKDFGEIKKSIAYKLVNRKNNKKLLSDVPYFEYLDLAVVFYFMVNTAEISDATVLIHNAHLELWNVSREELYEIAKINTPKLFKYNISDMRDIISGFVCEEFESGKELSETALEDILQTKNGRVAGSGMFVLTNKKGINGAACILYDGVVQSFAECVKNDVYIIPSSIHEVIMIPEGNIAKEELNKMVEQVNDSEVECCDVLSDHVYKYILNEGKIVIP